MWATCLILGGLDEETTFVGFDVDCDANLILGYDLQHAHDLAFLYDTDEVCFCAVRHCTSGRRVRLDLTLDKQQASPSRLTGESLLQSFGTSWALLVSDPPQCLVGPRSGPHPPAAPH